MNPTNQRQLHDPEKGVTGDCFTAVLASLLHLPITFIPLFIEDEPEGAWVRKLNKWLRPFGLAYVCLDPSFSLEYYGIEGLNHDISGDSPRFPGLQHACAALDGKLVFDPHLTKQGLNEISSWGVFIILDPSKVTRMYCVEYYYHHLKREYLKDNGVNPTEVFMTDEVRKEFEKDLYALYQHQDSVEFNAEFDGVMFRQHNKYGIVFK